MRAVPINGNFYEYQIEATLSDGTEVVAGNLSLETSEEGRHKHSRLTYTDEWIERTAGGFDLDPVHAPRSGRSMEWRTAGATPPILDDLVPGIWQGELLHQLWRGSEGSRNASRLHDFFSRFQNASWIGALRVVPTDSDPEATVSELSVADIEGLAQGVEAACRSEPVHPEILSQLCAHAGVGGARPKLLVSDDETAWIAKFRRPEDPFDQVAVEAACLALARTCGIPSPRTRIRACGASKALLVERFDTTSAGGRRHLVSANSLLKDSATCLDARHAGYDDLARLITRISVSPESDRTQLYAQMLFNRAINNQDDHLRNFSLMTADDGFRLTPAYDLVPSPRIGGYPVLSVGHRIGLPKPGTEEALEAAEIMGVGSTEARRVNEALRSGFQQLPDILEAYSVGERDRDLLARVCWKPT